MEMLALCEKYETTIQIQIYAFIEVNFTSLEFIESTGVPAYADFDLRKRRSLQRYQIRHDKMKLSIFQDEQ